MKNEGVKMPAYFLRVFSTEIQKLLILVIKYLHHNNAV